MKNIGNDTMGMTMFIFKTLSARAQGLPQQNQLSLRTLCSVCNVDSQLFWKAASRVQLELDCYIPLKLVSPNPEWLTDTLMYSLALSAYWVTPGPRSKMKIYNSGNGADKSLIQGTQQTCKRPWEKTQVQVLTATKWELFLKISHFEILEIK